MYFKKRIGITPKLELFQFLEGWQKDWNTGSKKKMVGVRKDTCTEVLSSETLRAMAPGKSMINGGEVLR